MKLTSYDMVTESDGQRIPIPLPFEKVISQQEQSC